MNDSAITPTYQIGGKRYRLEPLSWQQNKWLGEHIFKGLDMQTLNYAVIHDLLREKGPLFMAICLLAEGQTRLQHAKQPFAAIQSLAQEIAGELTGGEVALFGPHFFRSNQPDQMAMLVDGKTLQKHFEDLARSLAPGETGSNAASSPSVTETSPELPASSPSGDPLIQIRTSSDALSDAPSISPSLVGSASRSPG